MSCRMGIYSQAAGGDLPLLLDIYTGASAAYSLRKIAVATTNVIKVRRTNGLTPVEQDFTAEQITDGTLLAFTGSGDGRVVTWYDQSGNNAHATQVTQNRQPRIVSSGVLVLDSSGVNPTMEFHVNNVGSTLNAPLVGSQPFTLFNLRRYRVGGTTTRVAIGYAGSGNSYADNNIAGSFRTYYGAYVIQGANNTDREIFYSLANGASTAVSLNGGSEVIGNAGTAGASALTIGAAGLNFAPEVNEQEIIIYNSNQSSNKAGILTNINTHYNLYEPLPYNGSDVDANAYINAGGITNFVEIAAIEQLFLNLKGTGSTTNNSNFYSKLFALYPISPTSLAAGAVNAANPSTYDINWYNSPTYGTTGVTGNGSNMYGDTNFTPSTHGLSINDIGMTCDTATTTGGPNNVDMGTQGGSNFMQINATNGTYTGIIGTLSYKVSGTTGVTGVRTLVRSSSSGLELYLNGVTDGTDAALGGALLSSSIFLMGRNDSGSLNTASARKYRFFAIHKGLTANEAKDFSDAITTYNANVISGGR